MGCSSLYALNTPSYSFIDPIRVPGGAMVNFDRPPVDFGFFDVFGVEPVAGRLFSRNHGPDGSLTDPKGSSAPSVIINETGARDLGFSKPKAAVGRRMHWDNHQPGGTPAYDSVIVSVVPDLPVTVRTAATPTFYVVAPGLNVVSIRMTGKDLPGTIRAIESTWKHTEGWSGSINEIFLAQSRAALYFDLMVQSGVVAIAAGLAMLIACLGLFALSAYTAERRTKEIGIRKVMGAETGQVLLLLVWQFTLPVLPAIVVALPIGALAMQWWLHGFVYHVQLSAWTFVLAAVLAVVITWATVSVLHRGARHAGGCATLRINPHLCSRPWLMERDVSAWDAAAYTGMTVQTLEWCHGHHRRAIRLTLGRRSNCRKPVGRRT